MKELSNRYLVDLIDWRCGNPDGKYPNHYWFDVNMEEEFWIGHVSNYVDEETNEREALEYFLIDYLDKVYSTDVLGARVRSIDEMRGERIEDILSESPFGKKN